MHAHCMYKHVRWRSMHAGTLQRVQEDLTLTRARTLSLTLSRRARRGTRSSSRRRSTRSGRTSTLTRRGRRPSTRPRRRSSLACSTPARYHRRARSRCSQPERSPTAPVARPLARGELLGLRGAPLPLPCSCRRGVAAPWCWPKVADSTAPEHAGTSTRRPCSSSPRPARRAMPTAPTASAGRSSSATPTCALPRRTLGRSSPTSMSTPR